jgi:hypothetical protein
MSQIGRTIASSGRTQTGWKQGPFREITAAKDSASRRPSRISSRQLDSIYQQLTNEDLAVLHFLAEVRLATGFQIARRLWAASDPTDIKAQAARRAFRRLEDWRIIDRLPRRMGGVRGGSSSIVYTLGPAGRRLLARTGFETRRLDAPGDRFVRHTLAITELVVGLHEAALRGELDLIELQTEPSCWRGFLGLLGARLVLKPDLFVRIGSGAFEDRWWIEVDLATESASTITSKAKVYLGHYRSGDEQGRHGVYPRVVWAVPDRRRSQQVSGALGHLPPGASRIFSVWLYEEVEGRLAAEAAS